LFRKEYYYFVSVVSNYTRLYITRLGIKTDGNGWTITLLSIYAGAGAQKAKIEKGTE